MQVWRGSYFSTTLQSAVYACVNVWLGRKVLSANAWFINMNVCLLSISVCERKYRNLLVYVCIYMSAELTHTAPHPPDWVAAGFWVLSWLLLINTHWDEVSSSFIYITFYTFWLTVSCMNLRFLSRQTRDRIPYDDIIHSNEKQFSELFNRICLKAKKTDAMTRMI